MVERVGVVEGVGVVERVGEIEGEIANDVGVDSEPMPPEVAALVDAVGGLLEFKFGSLQGKTLAGLLPTMDAVRNQMAAVDAGYVGALNRSCVWARKGHASVGAMLKSGNGHPADGGARARRASRLIKMRLVKAAFESGQITVDHVRVLGELTQRRWRHRFAEAESYLVDSAINLSWREFQHVIDVWKVVADPDEPDLKHQSDLDAREFHLSRSFNDRGICSGVLTPEARVIFREELDRISRQLLHHDREEAKIRLGTAKVTAADLDRSPQQRRHDAIVIMAQRSAAADADAVGGNPIVHIRASQASAEAVLVRAAGGVPDPVDVEDFEMEFDDGTPLTDDQFLKYWAHAKIHSVVVGQTGAILFYGTGRSQFSKHQKDAVAYRDRFCACGCGLLARLCDIDHIVELADAGPSDVDNAQPKCRTSHTFKTEHNKRRRRKRRAGREPVLVNGTRSREAPLDPDRIWQPGSRGRPGESNADSPDPDH